MLLLTMTALSATEWPVNVSVQAPDGVCIDPELIAAISAAADQTRLVRVVFDDQGQLANLCLHQASWSGRHLERAGIDPSTRPGVDDAAFAALLARAPDLRGLRVFGQERLTDDAFAALAGTPALEVFCIEGYLGDGSGRFMRHLRHCRELRWLELKHCPGLGSTIDELGNFPRLIRLELDDGSAEEPGLAFLAANPQVIDLEIHRTELGTEQWRTALAGLPALERLHFKQAHHDAAHLNTTCLSALAGHAKLRVVDIVRWYDRQVVWENGIEHLLSIPTLEHVTFIRPPHEDASDHQAAQGLFTARPDLAEPGPWSTPIGNDDYPGLFP